VSGGSEGTGLRIRSGTLLQTCRRVARRNVFAAPPPPKRSEEPPAEPGALHAEPTRWPRPTWARPPSIVTFFRSRGGAVGVSVLGSIMSTRISHYAADTIGQLSPREQAVAAKSSGSGSILNLDLLPPGVRTWLESAYGHGIGDIFLHVTPIALLALLVTLFIKAVPLRTSGALTQAAGASAETASSAAPVPADVVSTAPATDLGVRPVSGRRPRSGSPRSPRRPTPMRRRHRGPRLRPRRRVRPRLRPDRLRRRLPAADLHHRRERRTGHPRHPPRRHQRRRRLTGRVQAWSGLPVGLQARAQVPEPDAQPPPCPCPTPRPPRTSALQAAGSGPQGSVIMKRTCQSGCHSASERVTSARETAGAASATRYVIHMETMMPAARPEARAEPTTPEGQDGVIDLPHTPEMGGKPPRRPHRNRHAPTEPSSLLDTPLGVLVKCGVPHETATRSQGVIRPRASPGTLRLDSEALRRDGFVTG